MRVADSFFKDFTLIHTYKPDPNTLCNAKTEILQLMYRNQI